MSGFSNRPPVTVVLSVVLIIGIAVVVKKYVSLTAPKPEEIESITVNFRLLNENYLSSKPITVDSEEEIRTFVECSNIMRYDCMESWLLRQPIWLLGSATFTLKDGSQKSIGYSHSQYSYGRFDPFLKLDSVIEKRNPVYSVDTDDVGKAVFTVFNDNSRTSVSVAGVIEDKEAIEDIIEFGKVNGRDYRGRRAEIVIDIHPKENGEAILAFIPIFDDVVGFETLCEKHSEIAEAYEKTKKPESLTEDYYDRYHFTRTPG